MREKKSSQAIIGSCDKQVKDEVHTDEIIMAAKMHIVKQNTHMQ